jgi:sugar lactone lactonase YvrE
MREGFSTVAARSLAVLLAFWSVVSDATAQISSATLGLMQWKSLTSLLDARDVTTDYLGNLWVVTSGGIFVCDPRTRQIMAEYRPGQGLFALSYVSVARSEDGELIVAGASDGTLELLSASEGPKRTITDIRRAADQYPRRAVNDVRVYNGRIYAATDFGIVVLDAEYGVPLETVDVVARFSPKTAITALVIRNDTLFAAGAEGVASIWLGVPSLRDQRQWQVWQLPAGWQWDSPAAGLVFDTDGRLIVATQTTILRQNGQLLEPVWQRPASSTDVVVSISQYNGTIVIGFGSQLLVLGGDGTPLGGMQPSPLRRHRTLEVMGVETLVGCTASNGISLVLGSELVVIAPNSLRTNTAYDLAVDTRGNLWVATASGGRAGSGFACRIGQQWYTFTPETDRRVPSPYYYRVAALPTGEVWLSSWGAGLLRAHVVGDDSIGLDYYNADNSPLVGFPTNPSYTVPGSVAGDARGTAWIAHWGNWIQGSAHVIARDSSGRFHSFTYPGNPPNVGYFMYIAIDAAGTKWLGSYRTDADGSGLAWFNDGGTLEDLRDDRWGRLTVQAGGLPANTVTALAVDRTGMLWVGTTAGLATIVNPTAVLSGSTPFVRTVRELRGIAINAIMVDALNNKWVATPNGIWIIGDDGVTILGTITQAQYPVLLSNDVRALATDVASGIIYVGTERGINAIKTLAILPRTGYQLQLYPQPFDPEQDLLTIDGLAAETELRISTISGMTLRTIRTQSRMALWDGRDDRGNLVPSGVYLVHAVSLQSGDGAVAKVVVQRSGAQR